MMKSSQSLEIYGKSIANKENRKSKSLKLNEFSMFDGGTKASMTGTEEQLI